MKLFTLFLLFLTFPWVIQAQISIKGSVTTEGKKPVVQVNVSVKAQGSKALSHFTATDQQGEYILSVDLNADSLEVIVSGLQIGKYTKIVPNQTGTVDFIVAEKALEIREVVVSQPKIIQEGDTLNYSVSAFSNQNDRVIGDVLKKMPGIEVSPSGEISYQGAKINKFYVENMDLLQGRYGIATRNIPAKDIAVVQVLENHQPIKALQDKVHSIQAAINLKLKESAKGTFSANGLAGAGYSPVLWNAELIAMYFARTHQNISTYKSNNSGDDVTAELNEFYSEDAGQLSTRTPLSVQSPSTPPFSDKRYLQNRSHAMSFNNLYKLWKNYDFNINASYYNDWREKEAYSLSEYYLKGDSVLKIEERINNIHRANNADIALRLNANTNSYYFNNLLKMSGKWDNENGTTHTYGNGNDETITQHLDKPFYQINNTLNLIKNSNDKVYNLYFFSGYSSSPHTLSVSPVMYNFFGEDIQTLEQQATSENFVSILRTSYGFNLAPRLKATYTFWGRADLKNLDSELHTIKKDEILPTPDSLKNNLAYNEYKTGVSQSYSYQKNRFRIQLDLPLHYTFLSINNKLPGDKSNSNRLYFNPSLLLEYNLTNQLKLTMNSRYNEDTGDLYSNYTGYIMQTYRNFVKNTPESQLHTKTATASLSLNYKNPLQLLFWNFSAGYNRSSRNILYGYEYYDILRVKTSTSRQTHSEGFRAGGNITKNIDILSTSIKLSANYVSGSGKQLNQQELLKYTYENLYTSLNLQFDPFSKLNISYTGSFNESRNEIEHTENKYKPIRVFTHQGEANLFATPYLTIKMHAEHRYNNAILAGNRNISFLDAKAVYRKKQFDFELEYSNILNTKRYTSVSFNEINSYTYSYELRPAAILFKARFKLK